MYKVFLTNTVIYLLVLSSITMSETQDDPIGFIMTGATENTAAIKNISFDYSIEYRLTERRRISKAEQWQKQLKERGLSEHEQLQRAPTIENTLRTGTFIRDASAFKITNKVTASTDQKLFIDESTICDGVKLTKINNMRKTAAISHAEEYNNSSLSYFPDNFQNLFLDGKTLQDVFDSKRSTFSYLGRQVYEEAEYEAMEITTTFTKPDDVNDFIKDRVWIVPECGFLIKRGISFKVDPNKPINSITTEFKEISNGIWYYSKILFESFPSGDLTPDVTMILTLSDIKINQLLPKEIFQPDLSDIPHAINETLER